MSGLARSPARLGAAAGFGILVACLAPAPTAQADSVTHVANVALATHYPFSYLDKAEGQADTFCATAGGAIFDGGALHYPSIQLLDFGFDIPVDAEITAIAVNANAVALGGNHSQGAKVRLLWGGVSSGSWYGMSIKGSGSNSSVACAQAAVSTLSRSDWGHPFTRVDVNDTAFGVELMANVNGDPLLLDNMAVTVEYGFVDRIFANGFDEP